jgi:membrane protein implicated in regulation of membrane protease activity
MSTPTAGCDLYWALAPLGPEPSALAIAETSKLPHPDHLQGATMDGFLYSLTHYPGVIPTALLGVMLLLWLIAMVGLLDLDSFGPDWLGGGELELEAEGDVPGMLVALGLDRMPFSIVLSTVLFFWWLLTLLGAQWTPDWLPLPGWISGTLVLILAFVLAVPIAAKVLGPFRHLFRVHSGATPVDLIGRRCKVLTLRVDEGFGQVRVDLGEGSELNLKAWARTPNELTKGSQALILSHDEKRNRYEVEGWDG